MTIQAHHGPKIDANRALTLAQVQTDGPSFTGVFKRAFDGSSLRAAVDAKCAECCWLDRAAIRDCTATNCPLHAVRPYQGKGGVL